MSGFESTSGIPVGPVGPAVTAANGIYTLIGLGTGRYSVQFSTGCGNPGNYASLTYRHLVPVTAGATTTAINGSLFLAGTVTGTVTAAAGGAPLAGICVAAFPPGVNFTYAVATSPDGTYNIAGLAPGLYSVEFSTGCGNTGNYAPAVYPTSVHVKAGATTRHINAALTPGGTSPAP